jgi:hypothetical protein
MQVDTVGGTPLAAHVLGLRARWVTSEDVEVTWETALESPAVAFVVARSSAESGPFEDAFEVLAGDESYTAADRPGYDEAWYRVGARYASGAVDWSEPVRAEGDRSSQPAGCGCSFGRATSGTSAVFALALLALALRRGRSRARRGT